jgi:hypothetical protein
MIKPNTNTVDYTTVPKNSYVGFDAISLRNLIIQRLNDKNIFTDQNYIGSNLASIIDIVSYAFNTLMFYLNRTSTESMFTEAQLYENINRIVKLLDYRPVGYQTSTLSFQVSADAVLQNYGSFFTIPRYSYITVGNMPFSFNEDISFSVPKGITQPLELTNLSNTKLLYQGIFRESPVYDAVGGLNETFVLNTPGVSIDHFNLHVYVYEHKKERWVQYTEVSNLYTEQPYSTVYEKRLNSDTLYEFTFGDGIAGRKLESGDKVVIYSLQSSGTQGIVGPNALYTSRSASVFDTVTFNGIYKDVKQEKSSIGINSVLFRNLKFDNIAGSTIPRDIESADSIRKNAPTNFKSQYRLVTQKDFETFVKINHNAFISDVKVFNNWEYMSLYLKYFNDMQVSPTSFRQIAFNQVQYADACNFNNIYICAVPKVSQYSSLNYLLPAQKEKILSSLYPVKMLTSEINFMDPIFKSVSFGMGSISQEFVIGDKDICRIEIVKTSGSNRTNQGIINEVATVIQTLFDSKAQVLGNTFDFSLLTSQLLQIDGVSQLNTVRLDTGEKISGLSFFVWNPNYPDLDKTILRNDIILQPFEFLFFEDLVNVSSKFFVTESSTNSIKF